MTTTQPGIVLRRLRDFVRAKGARSAPDQQLLRRFVQGREEAAFAALVRRHGPLVLGVCRRVLHQEQDAEDAFQATSWCWRAGPVPSGGGRRWGPGSIRWPTTWR